LWKKLFTGYTQAMNNLWKKLFTSYTQAMNKLCIITNVVG
jgi:hypothetical protein